MTHILDKRENWEFDLNRLPQLGPLKVIYENGTVRNTEWEGEWEDFESLRYGTNTVRKSNPIAYRLTKNLITF